MHPKGLMSNKGETRNHFESNHLNLIKVQVKVDIQRLAPISESVCEQTPCVFPQLMFSQHWQPAHVDPSVVHNGPPAAGHMLQPDGGVRSRDGNQLFNFFWIFLGKFPANVSTQTVAHQYHLGFLVSFQKSFNKDLDLFNDCVIIIVSRHPRFIRVTKTLQIKSNNPKTVEECC